jgi:hypothetical protein
VPKVVGPLLVVLGIVPVVAMIVSGAEVGVVGSSALIVWLPLMLSGVFFTLAGYRHASGGGPSEPQEPREPQEP